MFKKTLYIYLPSDENYKFNFCHCLSNHRINYDSFRENIPLLMDQIQYYDDIEKIQLIGGQPMFYPHLDMLLQVLSFMNIRISFLTNGVNILRNLQLFNGLIDQVHFTRLAVDDFENKFLLLNSDLPSTLQLQDIINLLRKNNIQSKIIVPLLENDENKLIKFVEMTKYLQLKDITFRQIISNKKQLNKTFFEKFDDRIEISKDSSHIVFKKIKGLNVKIQSFFQENNYLINNDYLVYHPDGILTNNWNDIVNLEL